MKKLVYSAIALAVSVLSLTSCEDVPAPYTLPTDSENTEIKVAPKGSGTAEDPFNVVALDSLMDNEFDANQQNTVPLFVVFEEAGDCKLLFDEDNVKRIYNQGSKMKLSTITILQMFVGEGSKRFQRMAGQALLKVSFKCATEGIRYLIEVIPPDHREFVKSRIPMLGIGQALICGEFEKSDGSFEADCYVTEKPDLRHHS